MRERNPIVGISIAAAIDVLECTVDRLIHAHRRGIPSSLDRRRLPCNHSLDLTVKRERSAALGSPIQPNREPRPSKPASSSSSSSSSAAAGASEDEAAAAGAAAAGAATA